MPKKKSLSLTVRKLWPRLKVFLATESQTDRWTGQNLNAPEFHSRGIKKATRTYRLVPLEFAKNQYHRFTIALFIHLFLFKVRVTGIIRKRIN